MTLSFPEGTEATLDVEQKGLPRLHVEVGLDGTWRTFPGRRAYPARARGSWQDDTTFTVELDELALINHWVLKLTYNGKLLSGTIEDTSGNPGMKFEGTAR